MVTLTDVVLKKGGGGVQATFSKIQPKSKTYISFEKEVEVV